MYASTLRPHALCSRLIPSTSHRSGSPGASCGVALGLMYSSTPHPRAPCSRLALGTSHHSGSPGAICGVAWRLMYVQYTSPPCALQLAPGRSQGFKSNNRLSSQGLRTPGATSRNNASLRVSLSCESAAALFAARTSSVGNPSGERAEQIFQLLTAVQGPYPRDRTACRTRRRGSGRASRSCRCWRRSRRS